MNERYCLDLICKLKNDHIKEASSADRVLKNLKIIKSKASITLKLGTNSKFKVKITIAKIIIK